MRSIRIVSDARELARVAAEELVRVARNATAGSRFTVALAGGSTPRELYRVLAGEGDPPYRERIDWRLTTAFVGDERAVPPDHPDSNYGMIRAALVGRVPLDPASLCGFDTADPDPEAAADRYAERLGAACGASAGEVPRLDLVLLGMGPDGHIASLFPGSEALLERRRLACAPWVDRLAARRYTLAPPVIARAREVFVLVAGEAKAETLRDVLEGPHEPSRLPAQLLRDAAGQVTWLVDRAAAARLGSIH